MESMKKEGSERFQNENLLVENIKGGAYCEDLKGNLWTC
jgi:hypothetical protein